LIGFPENFAKRATTAVLMTLVFSGANLVSLHSLILLLFVTLLAALWEWWELSHKWGGILKRIAIAVLWFCPALLTLTWLRYIHGPMPVFWAVLVIVASDVGAYFFGRSLGKTKLLPKISPRKTWEGLCGGLTAAGIVGLSLGIVIGEPWIIGGVLIALSAAVAGVIGDLVESVVKRRAGVKDSGKILPGHGGVLDRLDSHLFGLPVFALGVMILGWPS
jgi:phosphatidate cytidylyltransferase